MTDGSSIPVPPGQRAPEAPVQPDTGIRGFFATSTGRIVLIVGAVVVLGALIAAVAFIALGALGGGGGVTSEPLPGGPGPGVTAPAGGAGSLPATVAVVPDVSYREVFTPRDPFEPVLLPASASEESSTTGASEDDPNVLTLTDIVVEDGVRKGVFKIAGNTYTAGPGERLGDTAWEVVAIGNTSATMMFGDSQVVLTVGQGLFTK